MEITITIETKIGKKRSCKKTITANVDDPGIQAFVIPDVDPDARLNAYVGSLIKTILKEICP